MYIFTYLQNDLNNKIIPERFASRSEHSTTLLLTKLTRQLSENHNNDMQTVSVFLNVEKAYECVCYEGLLYKLIALYTPIAIVKIIEFFWIYQTFRTKIEDHFTTTNNILAGAP